MTRPSDRRLLRYAGPALAYLAGLVLATVAIAGTVILQAQLLAAAIAGTLGNGVNLSALHGTIIALAVVVAARAALAWAVEALSYRASAGVKSRLRRDLLHRSVELGPRWLATRRAGGTDITTLAGDTMRTIAGLCAQDAHVFDTTLGENLRLARREATDGQIRAALRRAGLLEWVDGLPAGLDTDVGEYGVRLSGGQRQRLSLARVLLADFPVLVLDEPTDPRADRLNTRPRKTEVTA